MAALRNLAVAGPGPQTWLYRSTLALCSANHQLPTSTPSRTLHITTAKSATRRQRYVKRQADVAQKALARDSLPNEPETETTQSAGSGNVRFIPEDVILLGVPPEYPIKDIVDQLLMALKTNNLDLAIRVWSHLWDLRCTSRLTSTELNTISICIKRILFGKDYPHLGKMALTQPATFGHLRNIALETASRGHCTGLYAFMLKLIGVGRPKDVVDLFEQCKDKMREYQGKKKEDLFSWDRTKRLNARLECESKEGVGLKELLMANIASHTLLNTINEDVLLSMLDSHVDLRPSSTFDFRPIDKALRASKSSNQIYKQFKQNIDKLVLALMCYHPNALLARISTLGTRRAFQQIDSLYDRVLEASIGPNAFLRPRELNDFSDIHRNIPIPPSIWLQFMKIFEWKGDVDRIINMIDQDLPQRGLEPNGNFLSSAMFYMSVMAQRKHLPPSVRSKALAWVGEYWRRLTAKEWHTEDGPFSKRIRTLSILSITESKYRREIPNLYDAAKAGHLGRIGPKTRGAFVEFFIKQFAHKQALDKAWEVFQSFPYEKDHEGTNFDIAFSVFIRRLALGPWSPKEKLRAYKKITKLFVDTGLQIHPHSLGPLLSIQLETFNLPMETIVQLTLDATRDSHSPDHGIQRWTKVLYGLLTKWTHTSSPNLKELEAGLMILEKASKTKLYGVTRTRQVGMWMSFLGPLTKTDKINAEKRQEFIDLSLNLFPGGGKENVSISMWFEIISNSFNRNDRLGYGEGFRRWNELRSIRSVPSIWWNKMLILLIKHEKIDWALDLVNDAWNNENHIAKINPFFLRAKSNGLITKLGLDEELEYQQNAYLNNQHQHRDGGSELKYNRGRKEVIAFAEDFEYVEEVDEEADILEDDEPLNDEADDEWDTFNEDED